MTENGRESEREKKNKFEYRELLRAKAAGFVVAADLVRFSHVFKAR